MEVNEESMERKMWVIKCDDASITLRLEIEVQKALMQ